MATTKVIPGVLDLNQASSSTGLKMPSSNAAYSGPTVGEGMMRNEVGQTSNGSASCMQHYNGTDWKNFVNTVAATTCDCSYPSSIANTALYQMETNADNSSTCATSGSYNGTQRGMTYTAGKFGNAATFGGGTDSNASTGSQIYIDNSVWGGNTSTFSVSLWFKGSTTPSETPLIGNGSTIGSTNGFAIYTTANGNLNGSLCSTGSGGPQVFFGNTTNISDNQWHHIAFTFDNSNSGAYVLYLDNQSHASGTTAAFTGNPTPTFDTYIGNRWNRNENGVINGQIDQLRIFANTILTGVGGQVTDLFNEVAC